MPAFSFKERFVPMVKDGSKPGTIRNFRKHPFSVGTPAHLYYGMRTKFCQKLIDTSPLINQVYAIVITESEIYFINTNWLSEDERTELLKPWTEVDLPHLEAFFITARDMDVFAWEDGFRYPMAPEVTDGCFEIMKRYWRKENGLPYVGVYTQWGKSQVDKK